MKLFFSKTELDRTVELLMQRTIKGFLWIIVFLVILSNLGVDVTAFIAGLGVVGFIIGFATKDVLSNVVAGLFLLINRPFKVGDEVEVAKVKGIVHEMNLAACVLHQGKDYVMVPNGKIWGAPIYNLTRLKSKKK
jgi:small conductance mechanosensitive channel